MVEFIVEGINIELDTNTIIELTYSINDIRNPISTNNTWSKSIEVPGTDNNNDTFSFLYENNIDLGFNPNLKKDCEIRVNSVPVIEGFMRMDETGIEDGRIYYKLTVFGVNTNIFEDMGDALLTELDLSSYEHLYSKDAVTGSWTGVTGDGYYYPWMNYSDIPWQYNPPDTTGITYGGAITISGNTYPFYPGFYIKTLTDKIFETYGYTYDSTFFNSDLYKSLFIPFNSTTTTSENIIIVNNLDYQTWHVAEWPESGDVCEYHYSGLTEYDPGNLYYPYQVGWEPSIQTPSDGYWSFRIQGNSVAGTGWEFQNGSFTVSSVKFDGTFPTELYKIEFTNPGSYTTQYNFDFSFSIPDKILKGRRIVVQPYAKSRTLEVYKAGYNYTVSWTFNTPTSILNATTIKPSETLPVGLKQKELLTTLIIMFNLYIERDPNDMKKLTIEPYDNYYSRSSDKKDWTYKVDESSRQYKLMSELNSGSYLFTYKTDSDYGVKNYVENTSEIPGQLTKYIQTNFLSTQTKIELLPSPTIIEYLKDSDLLFWPSIHPELSDTNAELSTYTGTVQTKWNWRILSKNIITDIPYGINYNSIMWGDFYTASHIPNYQGVSLTGTSLWFDWSDQNYTWDYNNLTGITTLYQNYWESYINLIKNQNSRLLTMDVYLTEIEVSNLRFYEKIFINDTWWILNQLIYSPTSGKGKAELLLIPTSDALELGYSGFTLSDTILYETQNVIATLNIINESQGNDTYKFYFEIISGGTVLTSYPKTGTAPRLKTISVTQSFAIYEAGNYTIRCRNEVGYQVDIPVTVYPMYEVTNLIATPNPGVFNENCTVSFDVVVTGDWTGTAQIGIQLIDSTTWFYKTFSGPGTQSCSKEYFSLSNSTQDYYVYDLLYYISQHLLVPVNVRPDAPITSSATSILGTSFISHCSTISPVSNYYWDVSIDNFSSYVGSYHDYDSGTETHLDVSGLNPGILYYFRVRAYYSPLYSNYSNVTTVTTVALPATPTQNDITSVTDTTFYLNWDEVTSDCTGYEYDISTDSGFVTLVRDSIRISGSGTITRQVTGMTGLTQYWSRIRSVGLGGTSSNSNTKTTTTTGELIVTTTDTNTTAYAKSSAITITSHVDNVNGSALSGTIEWKITDGSNVTISSGTTATGSIGAFSHANVDTSTTVPDTDGIYYAKSRMDGVGSWITSALFYVGIYITSGTWWIAPTDTLVDSGVQQTAITSDTGAVTGIKFFYTNPGYGGNDLVVNWEMFDSSNNPVPDSADGTTPTFIGPGSSSVVIDNISLSYPNTVATGYYLKVWLAIDPDNKKQTNTFDSNSV